MRTRWSMRSLLHSLLRLLATALVFGSVQSAADWTLDSKASAVHFLTIKADHVAEVHRFTSFNGRVDEKTGLATVTIDLASVDTLIPIRNERMREMLFKTAQFPTAQLEAPLNLKALTALVAGRAETFLLKGNLSLTGSSSEVSLEVTVARLADDRFLVSSRKPVIVNAASVGLSEGVEKLREVAGLPRISEAVPVMFTLLFDAATAVP